MTTIDTKVGLGSTAEGYRVVVHVKYGPDNMGNAERNPTPTSAHTHQPIPYPDVLSISGEVCDLSKRRSSPDFFVGGGQCIGAVRDITKPAGTLTLEDTKRFADLWDAWHLNTMRAACAHMDLSGVPDDLPHSLTYAERKAGAVDRYTWIKTHVLCPVSDYTYGAAWLAEDVPAEVVEEIATLIAKAKS